MAYQRVTWEDGQTALSAEHMNNIEDGIGEALAKSQGNADMWSYIRNLVYPVGSIYMSATLSTKDQVEALMGGTWEAWGQGRVPVGVGASDRTFAANETGGSSEVKLTSAQSGVPAHSHGVGTIKAKLINHVHSISHTHSMWHTHSVSGSTGNAGGHYHNAGDATHVFLRSETGQSIGRRTIKNGTGTEYANNVYAAGAIGTLNNTSAVADHSHTISLTSGGPSSGNTADSNTANSGNPTSLGDCTMSGSTGNNTAANAASAHTNLQPYITCYMYKRVG